jgi:predicted alpha/beta superfamily hydrolase
MIISTPKCIFTTSRQIIVRWLEKKQFDPRARPVDLRSRALGIRKRFFVYVPPSYAMSRQPLPVLYLFRGHEREWINGAQDASRQGRTVIDVYEELFEAGAVGPMILVFPGISSDDNSVPGLLVNFKQPQLTKKSGIGSGRFEDYLLQDIIPYVDTCFRTKPGARGTDGFSLGGFMAIKIAARYPTMFRTVGAFDGLYFWDDPADAHGITQSDAIFRNPMFDPVFGVEPNRDQRYAAMHNPPNLVRNSDPAALRRLTWLIEYGPQVGEPGNSNYYRGTRLCRLLADKGIINRGRGEIKTGTHTWKCADEHMRYVLPLHWNALQNI